MRIGNKELMQDNEAYIQGKKAFEIAFILDSAYNRLHFPNRAKYKQGYDIVNGNKIYRFVGHEFTQTTKPHSLTLAKIKTLIGDTFELSEEVIATFTTIKIATDYIKDNHKTYIIYTND
tara:strand:- start:493 stop:849 length:357 start_codon:yes stop_codon:yes gene_type:complete